MHRGCLCGLCIADVFIDPLVSQCIADVFSDPLVSECIADVFNDPLVSKCIADVFADDGSRYVNQHFNVLQCKGVCIPQHGSMFVGCVTVPEVEELLKGSAPKNEHFHTVTLAPYDDALTVGSHGCERMEFLGDAILSVVVTRYLYDRFPCSREGFLTKLRSKIVNASMLKQIAEALGLHAHVRDRRGGGGARFVATDDILEALIAAISIDRGLDIAQSWFLAVLEHHVDLAALVSRHESSRQHLTAIRGPVTFSAIQTTHGMISVCLRDACGVILGTATAVSRRDAEEEASRKALASLNLVENIAMINMPRFALACRPIASFEL